MSGAQFEEGMIHPIGFFHCKQQKPYELARQPVLNQNEGYIEVHSEYLQALDDIETCPKLWLIYLFHQNPNWKPKVQTPRSRKKIGVFATRAPYRPNPIGISCVDLLRVEKQKLYIKNHDLLDGSPILDIKPYLSYSDAFEDIQPGWIEAQEIFELKFSSLAEEQIEFLQLDNFRQFIEAELRERPFDSSRKRLVKIGDRYQLAYKTWRVQFERIDDCIWVHFISSAYRKEELQSLDDPYGDKKSHQIFCQRFENRVPK